LRPRFDAAPHGIMLKTKKNSLAKYFASPKIRNY
jgi:hypothetical protein